MAIITDKIRNSPILSKVSKKGEKLTAGQIQVYIKNLDRYRNIYIPEFTYGNLRVDALILDLQHRWIRGFEIKVNRNDFNSDEKWMLYSKFCSSLSVVCPEGLIQPEEIRKPFGLLWICPDSYQKYIWKKRPKNFQKRDALAWMYTYLRVLEAEFPRIVFENADLRMQIQGVLHQYNKLKKAKK